MDRRCSGAKRVFPGILRFEGQTYDYAHNAENTQLLDTLNVYHSTISAEDSSFEPHPIPNAVRHARSTWLGSAQEDQLTIYLALDLDKRSSLDPMELLKAAESLMFAPGCMKPHCAPLPPKQELLYCRSLAAAMGSTRPQRIRVVQSWGNQAYSFFVRGALGVRWYQRTEVSGIVTSNRLSIVRGESCLPCACAQGLKGYERRLNPSSADILIVLD